MASGWLNILGFFVVFCSAFLLLYWERGIWCRVFAIIVAACEGKGEGGSSCVLLFCDDAKPDPECMSFLAGPGLQQDMCIYTLTGYCHPLSRLADAASRHDTQHARTTNRQNLPCQRACARYILLGRGRGERGEGRNKAICGKAKREEMGRTRKQKSGNKIESVRVKEGEKEKKARNEILMHLANTGPDFAVGRIPYKSRDRRFRVNRF